MQDFRLLSYFSYLRTAFCRKFQNRSYLTSAFCLGPQDDKFGKPLLTNAGTHEAHFSKKEKVKVVEISFSPMNRSNWGEGYGQVAEFAIHTYPGMGTKTIHGGGRTS